MSDRIKKVLEKSPYGLTSDEIACQVSMSEKSVERFLGNLVRNKEVKKTKAGKNYFYRSIKCTIIFFFFIISAVQAQETNGSAYKIFAVVDSGGQETQATTLKLASSVGQPMSGISPSISFDLCAGFICNFIEAIISAKVTFLLEFNITGNENDTAFVDNETALKQYRPRDIVNYYICLHDINLSSSPAFGIIFAGTALNYINISSGNSFSMRVSQDIPGNEFILPITQTNCTVFNSRISQIPQFGTILNPFVALDEFVNAVELVLSYPGIDISGSFDRSGPFTLVIEKNDTDENQLVIKPA